MFEFLEGPFVTKISHFYLSAYTDAIARSVILLLAAWLVTMALRKRAAATRHLVWTLAVFAIVLLPLLSAVLPAWRALPGWATTDTSISAPLAVDVTSDAQLPPFETGVTFERLAPQDFALTDNPPATVATAGHRLTREPSRIAVSTTLTLLWVFGALATLTPVLAGVFALARLSRTARAVADGPWVEALKVAMAQMNLTRPVSLLDGGEKSMPTVWGVFRTRLLVPAEGLSWTRERRLVVLLHELAHVKRRDCLTRMVARLACSVYWFNPLVWFAWRSLQAESERACDDLVLAGGGSAADYAGHILAIVSGVRPARFANHAAIAMARCSGLEGRLVSILDETRSRRGLTRAALTVAVILAAAVVTPIAITKAATEPAAPVAAAKATKVTPEDLAKAVENGTLKRLVTTPDQFKELYGKPLSENSENKGGKVEVVFLAYDGFAAAFQRFHANEPFGLFALNFGQGWRELGAKGLLGGNQPAAAPDNLRKAIEDGTLKGRVTTADEFKELFGKPRQEVTEQKGGGAEVLFLTYNDFSAAFQKNRPNDPFRLFAFNFGEGWRDFGAEGLLRDVDHPAQARAVGEAAAERESRRSSEEEWFKNSVRGKDISGRDLRKIEGILDSIMFDEDTVWPPADKMPPGFDPKTVLENAKNPGLGVRALHQEGITGKGVNVAIIDHNMFLDHPEFADKIAGYFDSGCETTEASMHSPAVTSLLVGTSCGTAPDARVYFAGAPSWKADAGYYAEALDWIVRENEALPAGRKIRAVSVSAAPSGPGSPFTKNNAMWDEACDRAEKAGILIVDCEMTRGFVGSCFYDAMNPEDPSKCTPGFPGIGAGASPGLVLVPTSVRTSAQEPREGHFLYAYWGRGGLSWGVPYATGVMAMGWQLRPDLSGEWMKYLLYDSAYATKDGARIINPKEFVKRVKEAKVEPGQAPPAIPKREVRESVGDFKTVRPVTSIKTNGDVRWNDLSKLDLSDGTLLMRRLWFNEKTVWPPADKLPVGFDPKALLEKAKRPPLGVKDLHKDGITGKGVAIAILGQPVPGDHPEFAGKIAEYHDMGCQSSSGTSMVGPTVLSLAVGANCGTAPEAKVYFVAVPVWKRDATYSAQALDWIVERNKTLVGSEKIRLAADAQSPTGEWANRDVWDEARKRAEAAGILVVTGTYAGGFVEACGYDLDNSDDISKCDLGSGDTPPQPAEQALFVPAFGRTAAEEYERGDYGYHYFAAGGPLPAVPYAAGVLALGWQVKPELPADQMKELLVKSAYVTEDGWKVINPTEFIGLVKNAKAAAQ